MSDLVKTAEPSSTASTNTISTTSTNTTSTSSSSNSTSVTTTSTVTSTSVSSASSTIINSSDRETDPPSNSKEATQLSTQSQTKSLTGGAALASSHETTAQKIFAGRGQVGGTGLMCSNLRSNPFLLNTDQSTGSGSSSILAKPKFSLKPSSFGGGPSGDLANLSAPTGTNPFLRPAKLTYDSDEADNSDSSKAKEEETSHFGTTIERNGTSGTVNTRSEPSNSQAHLVTVSSDITTFGQPAATQGQSSVVQSSSFVFGEGLDDRVTNVTKENGTNGHCEEAAKSKAKTMEEAADEYKKLQESGPILPEVETKTGEEQESNVLQINCKLFLFLDEDKSWAEKGRGLLRLNDDSDGAHSRIVMRTAGIHRVILNTSVWASMLCEKANQKSLRFTGTDSDSDVVHVYLVTGSTADIDHLYSALNCRIQRLKQSQTTSPETTSVKRKTTDDDEELSPKKTRLEETHETSIPPSESD